jgi:hypothetical protein
MVGSPRGLQCPAKRLGNQAGIPADFDSLDAHQDAPAGGRAVGLRRGRFDAPQEKT